MFTLEVKGLDCLRVRLRKPFFFQRHVGREDLGTRSSTRDGDGLASQIRDGVVRGLFTGDNRPNGFTYKYRNCISLRDDKPFERG